MQVPSLVPVAGSTNVAAIGHDGRDLFMRFHRKDGRTALYRYPGVGAAEYRELARAKSVGRHFHQFIRGKYAAEKIEEKG